MNETYEVHLDNFEGPLDLLLYLIKKDDLDIYDIPIAKITREYLATLDVMQELNLEVAGDFLVLAATLMQIKARALLPAPPEAEEGGPDPRSELVEKLLEYQRFKGAAQSLEKRAEHFKDVFYRGAPVFRDEEKTLDLSLFDLLDAVREALDRAEVETRVLEGEPFPIEEKMEKILFLVESRPYVTLRELFQDERRRRAILACFLALLELIKLGKVRGRQSEIFGEVRIIKRLPETETPAPQAAAAQTPVSPAALGPETLHDPKAAELLNAPPPEPAAESAPVRQAPVQDALRTFEAADAVAGVFGESAPKGSGAPPEKSEAADAVAGVFGEPAPEDPGPTTES